MKNLRLIEKVVYTFNQHCVTNFLNQAQSYNSLNTIIVAYLISNLIYYLCRHGYMVWLRRSRFNNSKTSLYITLVNKVYKPRLKYFIFTDCYNIFIL